MRSLLVPVLALGLALLVGCSTDQSATESGTRLIAADAVAPIAFHPQVEKQDEVDRRAIDLELLIEPDRNSSASTLYMGVWTFAGAVEEAVTIHADWLGDNEGDHRYGYDFSPEGFEFVEPIYMQFKLNLRRYNVDPDCVLILLDLEDGQYEVIPSEFCVSGNNLFIWGWVEHFSKYVLGVGPPPENNGSNH